MRIEGIAGGANSLPRVSRLLASMRTLKITTDNVYYQVISYWITRKTNITIARSLIEHPPIIVHHLSDKSSHIALAA